RNELARLDAKADALQGTHDRLALVVVLGKVLYLDHFLSPLSVRGNLVQAARSAVTGSRRAARRAGRMPATAPRPTAKATHIRASSGVTRKIAPCAAGMVALMRDVTPNPMANPISPPTSPMNVDSRRNSRV